jgi:hypothetical protein
MIPPLFGKQEVGIWRVKKRFPRYGVPIKSLWPNIRFLPSIVTEKNATKNGHIQNVCSMCIKINKVSKQEVGIWWVQKRFPRYIEHICTFFVTFFSATIDDMNLIFGHKLHIGTPYRGKRFLTRQIPTKNATKNILDGRKDGRTDRGKTVYPPPPSGSGDIITLFWNCKFQ